MTNEPQDEPQSVSPDDADASPSEPPPSPPASGASSLLARLRGQPRLLTLAGAVGVLLVLVVGVVLMRGTDAPLAGQAVEISPAGEEAPRLGPVVVTFGQRPRTDDASRLIALEPAVAGEFAWLDERTLLFQPDFPGFARGTEYVVSVAGEQAGLDRDFVQSFTVEGELVVQGVIPGPADRGVPPATHIYVQFSRSVAPLTTLDAQRADEVIVVDPPVQGTGEWLNTSLYRFVPTDLKPSTTYRVRVPAGLTGAVDGVLEADYEWSFTTVAPALARSTPADGTLFFGRSAPLTLVFNQAMDRASVEAGVRLRVVGGEEVATSASWDAEGVTLTLTPTTPLTLSTGYEVFVPAGLAGALGGTIELERRVRFNTSDPPRLLSSSPSDGEREAGRWGITLDFNNPIDVESLQDRLTISGIDSSTLQLFAWDERQVNINVQLEPSTTYTISTTAGVVDREGLVLDPFTVTFTTGALAPFVSYAVPGQLATYGAGAPQVLYFFGSNVPAVDFELYTLTEQEVRTILSDGLPSAPANRPWTPSSAALRTWSEPLSGGSNAVAQGMTVLGGTAPLATGHYYLRTAGASWGQSLYFAVVDTVLTTKLATDELVVWALDYLTAEPIANLEVRVNGPGVSNVAARTDAQGYASVAVPRPRDVTNEYRAYRVEAQGTRVGLARTDWAQGMELWQIGVPLEYSDRQYVGYAYTDRPLYRSGETVHFKAILRTDDDARYAIPSATDGLRLVVTDSFGEEIVSVPVTLNDFGTFAGDFTLPEQAATGYYNLAVIDDRDPWFWLAYSSFQVAEFRRPEFRVDLTPGQADYVDGQTIEVTAEASFFFGGALAGAQVDWAVLGFPSGVYFEEYGRYSFGDYDYFSPSIFEEPLRGNGETVTGADGVARIRIPAALRAGEGTTNFDVSVTVLDQTGQAIAGSTSVVVHPAAVYVGVDASAYVARTGEPVEVQLVTVDTTGQPVGGRPVTVQVFEREWITVKEEAAGGTRRYRSEPRDTLVATLSTTTGADGLGGVEYTPTQNGQLRILASTTDTAGREARSSRILWVSGEGVAAWEIRNDSVIELVADRALYRPGDVAEVLVPAPFAGARALVTIERGGIAEHSTRTFEGNSEVLRIPITDAMLPNAFVGVVLYRPPTGEDPVPRFHIGYVELRVSTESRELSVAVERDREVARPGETVNYTFRVTDAAGAGVSAELSVAMVDASVLSLVGGYTGPTGLEAFWFNRGLSVATGSSLAVSIDRANDVLSEPSLGGKGGGADEREGTRSTFENTAYWEGQLRTAADGRATVAITLPDNLTTWRTTVRAITEDTRVGETTDDLLSTQPLLLRPALPRFLRAGDEVTLRTLVRNATETAQRVSVSIEVEGLDLAEGAPEEREIAPGESAEFTWDARASAAGTAVVTFQATGASLADAVSIELPVLFDVTAETVATGGVVAGTSQVEAVYLPAFALTEGGTLGVTLQGSLVGSLQSELTRLTPVTGESVTRIASRVLATIGARRAEGIEGPALLAGIDGDLRRLQSTQRIDGGWGWCQTCPSDVTITAWVLIALGEAREAGSEMVWFGDNAVPLLRQYLEQRTDVQDPSDPNERALMYYAVQRASGGGWPLNSMRAVVQQHRDLLTPWGQAYLVLGLIDAGLEPSDESVRALIADLNASTIPSANGNHWEGDAIYGSIETNVSMTALVLQALVAADPSHPLIEETARWLSAARTAQRWVGSVERAQAIMGLGDFAALTGERQGEYDYRATFDDTELLAGRFSPTAGVNLAQAVMPLTSVKPGEVHRLGFSRERADGRMYYTAALRYGVPASQVEALNRGLAVSRSYSLLSDPSRPVSEAALGDVIRVTLTVVATADRKFVQVDDLLPAGLEAIDTTLATTPLEVRLLLEEERRAALAGDEEISASGPWFPWYWSPWDETAVRDDRYTLFATQLPRGVHEYVYFARATTPGNFFVAPARAEESAFPEVFGRSDSTRFTVTPQ